MKYKISKTNADDEENADRKKLRQAGKVQKNLKQNARSIGSESSKKRSKL